MKFNLLKGLSLIFLAVVLGGFGGNDFLKNGENEFRKNNLNGAIESFTKSIEANPSARAYFFRAASYSALRRFEEAVQDYTKTLELKPDYENVYWSRAYCYANLGKFEEAERDYTVSLERDPNYKKMIYEMRAKVYFHQNELDKAEADLRELLKLDSENKVALEGLKMVQNKRTRKPERQWTEDEAKREAFKSYQKKIDISKVPALDPDHKENREEAGKAKGGIYIKNRFITVEPDGHYVVSLFNEHRVPEITLFFAKDGKTESFRIFSAPAFPRAAYIYCYSSCDNQGSPAGAGELMSISFHPSETEVFYFSQQGKLLFHQASKK